MDSLTFSRRTDLASSPRSIQDPNPKQTNRQNEKGNIENKNPNKCDRQMLYWPILAQSHLTARVIDKILVSRFQPR